jgi:coatomer subunit beta'
LSRLVFSFFFFFFLLLTQPKNDKMQIYWSESGDLLAICCETNFYILKFNREIVDKAVGEIPEEGLEDAFDVATEIQEG